MPRLKQLAPSIAAIRSQVASAGLAAKQPRRRDEVDPFRRLYHTARWQRVRWRVLTAAHFTCVGCGRVEPDTSKLVADHIVEARLAPERLFDEANLQCLCETCHCRDKQIEERRAPAL